MAIPILIFTAMLLFSATSAAVTYTDLGIHFPAAICSGGASTEECMLSGGGGEEEEEFDMEGGAGEFMPAEMDSRRVLYWRWRRRYISYGALLKDRVPCSRRGYSYYNCRPGTPVNPYTRGCSAITHCRS